MNTKPNDSNSAEIHLIDEALHLRTNFNNVSLFTFIQALAKAVADEALKETQRRINLLDSNGLKIGNPEVYRLGIYNFIFKQLLKENIR